MPTKSILPDDDKEDNLSSAFCLGHFPHFLCSEKLRESRLETVDEGALEPLLYLI